jgi:hypothetical protein
MEKHENFLSVTGDGLRLWFDTMRAAKRTEHPVCQHLIGHITCTSFHLSCPFLLSRQVVDDERAVLLTSYYTGYSILCRVEIKRIAMTGNVDETCAFLADVQLNNLFYVVVVLSRWKRSTKNVSSSIDLHRTIGRTTLFNVSSLVIVFGYESIWWHDDNRSSSTQADGLDSLEKCHSMRSYSFQNDSSHEHRPFVWKWWIRSASRTTISQWRIAAMSFVTRSWREKKTNQCKTSWNDHVRRSPRRQWFFVHWIRVVRGFATKFDVIANFLLWFHLDFSDVLSN